jgi:hypothetical protein
MGMDLTLESRPDFDIQQLWSETDGKNFIDVLFLSLGLIEEHLHVDLSPLKKAAGDEPTEEELEEVAAMTGKSAQEMLKEIQEKNNAAWQAPDDLLASLHSLVQTLSDHANNLPLADLKKNHPDRAYFERGRFLSDVKDLLRWVEEAKDGGAVEVRIFIV